MVIPLLVNTNFESEIWLKIKCIQRCEVDIAVVMANNESAVFNNNNVDDDDDDDDNNRYNQ